MKALKDKSYKKVLPKRKIVSAPNLPINKMRVRSAGAALVPPKDIRKYKNNTGQDKASKGKPSNTRDNKKLAEAHQLTTEEEKFEKDYQWLVKRNIIKMLGTERKKELSTKKKDLKSKTGVKKLTPQNKGKELPPRAVTATGVRHGTTKSQQRPQSSVVHHAEYFTSSKGTPAILLRPKINDRKSSMPKLHHIFDVFKAKQANKQKVNTKPDAMFASEVRKQSILKLTDTTLYDELKQAEGKILKKDAPKKVPEKTVKKSEKIAPKKNKEKKKTLALIREIQ